jgi:myo-inositol 2-dehydrogenase/D-chiro-inositol 1-dehydrogenase
LGGLDSHSEGAVSIEIRHRSRLVPNADGDVDTSVATLSLPTGALVQIDCAGRIGYRYDERIEVLGSSGMIEARRHRTGSVSRYWAGHVIDDGLHAGWFERVQPTYANALDHFRSLEEHAAITPSLDDGLKA